MREHYSPPHSFLNSALLLCYYYYLLHYLHYPSLKHVNKHPFDQTKEPFSIYTIVFNNASDKSPEIKAYIKNQITINAPREKR